MTANLLSRLKIGESMKQSALKRLEYHNHNRVSLIMFDVALILLTMTTSGSVFAGSGGSLAAQTTAQESKQADVRELKPGEPIERELAGGDAHSYRVMVTAGQYLHTVVQQKGIDVVVRLFRPDGQKLAEVDSPNGTLGPEPISVIAEVAGEYRLEVKALDEKVAAGRYEIKVEELRESSAKDRDRIAAERAFAEGEQFRTQGSAESLRKALEKYDEALTLWRKVENRQGEAATLKIIGVIYWHLGDNQKALEYYSRALLLWRAVGDRKEEASVLSNIGVVYWRLGDLQKALEYYGQALPLRREVGDRQGEAITLSAIGLAYDRLGKVQEALNFYNQSLVLQRAIGDRRNEATSLNNIGSAYDGLGELQKALEYYNQALSLHRAEADRRNEAITLSNIGVLYWRSGALHKALEYYGQALTLNNATGDRSSEAATLNNISLVHKSLGDLQKALASLNQGLSLFKALGDRRSEAITLNNIGVTYSQLGDHQKALETLNQSLLLRRAVGDRLGEAITLSQIGGTYSSLGKPEEALSYLEQALSLAQAVGDRDTEAGTLLYIAQAERDRGRLSEARPRIEASLTIIESMRTKFISQQLRTSFSASRQSFYEFYIDLLMQLHQQQTSAGHDVAAFGANERARARSLLELLAEARIDVKQGIAPALKQREKDLHAQVTRVQSELIQANSRAKPDQSRIAVLEGEFKKVETESEQVETEIRQRHPRYATLHYPTPLGLKDIQGLLDEKTVLLEYSLGKESSYLFAISKNDFLTARLPAAALLTNQVAALREAVAVKPGRMALSNYIRKGQSLYQALVKPASRLLGGKQSLIIVPDGILHYLPFEVLLESETERKSQVDLHQLPYLIRNYSISYSPSATVLANLRKSTSPRQKSGKMFLAFADPVYHKTESEQTSQIRSAFRSAFGEGKPWQLEPLPESRREVERIAKLYSPTQAGVFLGEHATEENVKSNDGPSQYRMVHFAVHGLLNENKPQYSGLVLSLPRDEKETTETKKAVTADTVASSGNLASDADNATHVEDGLLQVYEIFNLKMNADLVVLSACETGLGKETRGEGLVGLTQAFFYAGTSSLVVSLWKVQDRSTADLMGRFYRNLNNPLLNKSQALRQAQLEMIRKGDFSHPYYWAGFVLIGQP